MHWPTVLAQRDVHRGDTDVRLHSGLGGCEARGAQGGFDGLLLYYLLVVFHVGRLHPFGSAVNYLLVVSIITVWFLCF